MHALELAKTFTRGEWLEQRREGIGGSDAAAICGYDEWTSPFAVYVSKVEGVDSEAGEAARWGNLLEDAVAIEAAERLDLYITKTEQAYQHPHFPWMRANVDRLVYDCPFNADHEVGGAPLGLLEVKTTHRTEDWSDGPPRRVLIQVQHYLEVTGLERAWVAALLSDRRFSLQITEVARDDELIESLLAIEAKFWDDVEHRRPPAIDGYASTTDALKRLYATARPEATVDLPDYALDYLSQLRIAKQLEKDIAQDVTRWENELKALIGEAEVALLDGEPVCTWKSVTSHRVDTKAMKEAHPGIVEEFTKPSTSRRFVLKGEK